VINCGGVSFSTYGKKKREKEENENKSSCRSELNEKPFLNVFPFLKLVILLSEINYFDVPVNGGAMNKLVFIGRPLNL